MQNVRNSNSITAGYTRERGTIYMPVDLKRTQSVRKCYTVIGSLSSKDDILIITLSNKIILPS